jgi:hypothetical protein
MADIGAEHLINECRQIEDDCRYNAETHYILAARAGTIGFWVKFVPALIAAGSGAALLAGFPLWVAWLSVLSGTVFALQSIMDPDKKKEEHSEAGKHFTALKHDARSLYQAFYKEMEHSSFSASVRVLRERYNTTIRLTPQTAIWAFEEARKRIKAGRHRPDFEEPENGGK